MLLLLLMMTTIMMTMTRMMMMMMMAVYCAYDCGGDRCCVCIPHSRCGFWLISAQPKPEQNRLDGKANSVMLITYLVAGFISPLLGGVIDRVGKRGYLNVLSACLVVVVHVLLRNTTMYPVFPLVLLGFWCVGRCDCDGCL